MDPRPWEGVRLLLIDRCRLDLAERAHLVGAFFFRVCQYLTPPAAGYGSARQFVPQIARAGSRIASGRPWRLSGRPGVRKIAEQFDVGVSTVQRISAEASGPYGRRKRRARPPVRRRGGAQ